ncbi:MAG: type II secretion system protein [Pirellulales bacterium]
MTRRLPTVDAAIARPRRGAAAGGGLGRPGFTLVELLVVIGIMLVLLSLAGAAVSGARAASRRLATESLIGKLDAIIQQQYSTYASRSAATSGGVPTGMTGASYRAWYVRRNLISGDLPDRWTDVAAIAAGSVTVSPSGTAKLPLTAPQRAYAEIWNSLKPTDQYAGAECLFMIVMQGGIASCLDCGELRTAERGDKDGDRAYEFWDEWGNPIGFILWPAGLQWPPGQSDKFFSGSRSLDAAFPAAGTSPAPGLGMRPLIYSAGPDGEYGFNRMGETSNLMAGSGGIDCGNPDKDPTKSMAGPESAAKMLDNITNFDAEVKR